MDGAEHVAPLQLSVPGLFRLNVRLIAVGVLPVAAAAAVFAPDLIQRVYGAGYEASVELTQPIDGQRRFKGRLMGVEGDWVRMAGLEREVKLPMRQIRRAKLVLNDELLAAEAMKVRRAKE